MAPNEGNPKDRRRGLVTTILFHVAMVLLFIFYGLTYIDPPPEDGIAINFGYEEDGSGTTTQSAPAQAQPQTSEQVNEEVTTQEMVDAPSVNTEKPKKPVEAPTEKPKEEQKPDSRLQGALDRTKNQPGTGQGEGETTGGGDQGDPNGDRNSPNRTGNGGKGSYGDYWLGERKAMKNERPYECPGNIEGLIVVQVRVDNNGKTISATAGVEHPDGSKSNIGDPCFLREAEAAAKRTRWQPGIASGPFQTGYIKFRYKRN